MPELPDGIDLRPRRGDAFRVLQRNLTFNPIKEPVCRQCYYPVHALTAPRCPECGGDLSATGVGVIQPGSVPVGRAVVWTVICLVAWTYLAGFAYLKVLPLFRDYLLPWECGKSVELILTPQHGGYQQLVVEGEATTKGFGYMGMQDARASVPEFTMTISPVGSGSDIEILINMAANTYRCNSPTDSFREIQGKGLNKDTLKQIFTELGMAADIPVFELEIWSINEFLQAFFTGRDYHARDGNIVENDAGSFGAGNSRYGSSLHDNDFRSRTNISINQYLGPLKTLDWTYWLLRFIMVGIWFFALAAFVWRSFLAAPIVGELNADSSVLPSIEYRGRVGDSVFLLWRRLTLRPIEQIGCRRCGCSVISIPQPICPKCASDLTYGGTGAVNPMRHPESYYLFPILVCIITWSLLGMQIAISGKQTIDRGFVKKRGYKWSIIESHSKHGQYDQLIVTGDLVRIDRNISQYNYRNMGLEDFQIIVCPSGAAPGNQTWSSGSGLPDNEKLGVSDQYLVMQIKMIDGSLQYQTGEEPIWKPFPEETDDRVVSDWLENAGINVGHRLVSIELQILTGAIQNAALGKPYALTDTGNPFVLQRAELFSFQRVSKTNWKVKSNAFYNTIIDYEVGFEDGLEYIAMRSSVSVGGEILPYPAWQYYAIWAAAWVLTTIIPLLLLSYLRLKVCPTINPDD